MEAIVYQTLRDEMTSYLTAFRNFELGQYGIVVVVFSVLMTESNIAMIALKAIAIIGFIFMITKIGTELHNQATRLGSYILVAFELKALKAEKQDSDYFKYWILANRSSAFRGIRKGEKDRLGFRRELENFHFRQIVTITFFWVLANLNSYIVTFRPNTNPLGIIDFAVIGLFEFFFVVCVIFILKDRAESEDYGREQIRRWKIYCDNREENDNHYLSEIFETPKK